MLFTYVVLHSPFILGEQGNVVEVMVSEQEACTSHTATTVVLCCRHSLCYMDCLLNLSPAHHLLLPYMHAW